MIHLTQCPSCGSPDFSKIKLIKDFSVSGESFPVMLCNKCKLAFTQDIPDENEIGPYYKSDQYVSHSDISQGFIFKLYHLVRRFTLRKKRKLILKTSKLQSGSILDVGSGTGSFLQVMKSAGWDILGIEPDDTAQENALKLHGIAPLKPDALRTLPSESFDAITMWHVLEHVHHLKEEMQVLKRLLKKDGRIFIAVPNHTSYDARHYGQFWAAWDVPRHLYHFSPASMQFLCSELGLKIERSKPMWFDSFYISMLSEKYKQGHSNVFMAVLIGMISNLKALLNNHVCSSVTYVIGKE